MTDSHAIGTVESIVWRLLYIVIFVVSVAAIMGPEVPHVGTIMWDGALLLLLRP